MTNKPPKTTALGFLGTTLDQGIGAKRWERWRPTVALCQHEDLIIDTLILWYSQSFESLARQVKEDIAHCSPETSVELHRFDVEDPWDFEEVYGALFDFANTCKFEEENTKYLVHLTTGTHVAQICLFLLTEARYFPAKLIQTSPPSKRQGELTGTYSIIELDLSKYDRLASRFQNLHNKQLSFLKGGIETKNPRFNRLIEQIERVASVSREPMLLTGPTGAGKSQLARKIYELKRQRRLVSGDFVEVNCATLRGDTASSTLFGHVRGAFTGAQDSRSGLLRRAHEGLLFLDEIGELGLDEQAMLLRAIEQKVFFPMGSDREVSSDFQLIAGTNRDLRTSVEEGRFREDLLARINLWSFQLPGLRDRPEDILPNLRYELQRCSQQFQQRISMSREAEQRFLRFATSPSTAWKGNFRDFHAAMLRMATLSEGGRISEQLVEEEIERLQTSWGTALPQRKDDRVRAILGEKAESLDPFDRIQLEEVLRVCAESATLSEAGRSLFSTSLGQKKSSNDADRLRKYLARFGLTFADLRGLAHELPED